MSYALDISQFSPDAMGGPLTDDMVVRCLARGIDRFIVSTVNKSIAREQIAVLVKHPVEIQTYHAYEWGTFKAAQAEDVAFIAEVRTFYNLQKHWIDVESAVVRPVSQNIADTHWLVDSFTGICPTGLYSSPGWWQQFMGDTDEFAGVPWWVAHWNGKDSLTEFLHFGGITRCEMHQTLNDLFVEGVWCDTNYYERATPTPMPQPIPQPIPERLVTLLKEALAIAEGTK